MRQLGDQAKRSRQAADLRHVSAPETSSGQIRMSQFNGASFRKRSP